MVLLDGNQKIRLNSPVDIGSLSHYLQGFNGFNTYIQKVVGLFGISEPSNSITEITQLFAVTL